MKPTFPTHDRLRFAELTSAIGAGVAGIGIGAIAARPLGQLAAFILAAGLFMHAWGMFDKHRIEKLEGDERPAWSTTLYWICWGVLALLIVFIALRV